MTSDLEEHFGRLSSARNRNTDVASRQPITNDVPPKSSTLIHVNIFIRRQIPQVYNQFHKNRDAQVAQEELDITCSLRRRGMPPALLGDASSTPQLTNKSRKMDVAQQHKNDIAVLPPDGQALAAKQRRAQTQNFNYVWRTGLAGGVAGCAVS